MDLVIRQQFTPPDEIRKKFGLESGKPCLLLLQHPVTWQVEEAEDQMQQTMEAIDELCFQTIAVYPCSDPGYESIIKVLRKYEDKPYLQVHRNIDFPDFWGLMNVADVFIGNSSAGVMEAPLFKIPFVNIGIRQEGRLRADNVLDVDHKKSEILKAVRTALFDEDFRRSVKNCVSPYGDGQATERIVSILKTLEINERLLRKRMTY
jgi:UDP-hydrolysing UDP-N-acetyl-D-glucosamine 2-epimerase